MSTTFLPLYHDLVAAGVPEPTAQSWYDAISLLKSHADHMADLITEETDYDSVLRAAAKNYRKAMREIRP